MCERAFAQNRHEQHEYHYYCWDIGFAEHIKCFFVSFFGKTLDICEHRAVDENSFGAINKTIVSAATECTFLPNAASLIATAVQFESKSASESAEKETRDRLSQSHRRRRNEAITRHLGNFEINAPILVDSRSHFTQKLRFIAFIQFVGLSASIPFGRFSFFFSSSFRTCVCVRMSTNRSSSRKNL